MRERVIADATTVVFALVVFFLCERVPFACFVVLRLVMLLAVDDEAAVVALLLSL